MMVGRIGTSAGPRAAVWRAEHPVLVARWRARRLAVVDHALFGMALGAGFQLVEDWIRRVAGGRPGFCAVLLGDGSTQFRVLALFPGWQDSPSGEAFFAGHFLLTGLVALGVGCARRLRPRWGVRAEALPVALFVLVVLDHSLYNFHATLGTGPVPVPLANRTVRRWLGEPLEDAAGEAAETAAERARRQATEAGIPRGFMGAGDFLQFGRRAQGGFAEAGYDDVTLAIRGSAVTGVGHGSGLPFDQGRVSDFDLAVVSPQMWEQVQGMGLRLRTGGTRTPVLTPDVLRQLGLSDAVADLNAAAGRPVSLMLYRTADIAARGPSITWPRS